jgi:rod shape determining protein RodA
MSENIWRSSIDWLSFGAALCISLLGLLTMSSFTHDDPFFIKQSVWIVLGVLAFFAASMIDWRILRRSGVAAGLYVFMLIPLFALILLGHSIQGAKSWFDIGPFALQPVEFVKLALIIALAKYFWRRHTEIRNVRHILISGAYAFIVFGWWRFSQTLAQLSSLQAIWLGMVLISGISRWHLLAIFLIAITLFSGLWMFGFKEYQKERILTFIHPLADIHGAGYNAYQSTVAVGSGEIIGKGIGYGSQSKLRFLPEYQTDFIFAAFAEEWGLSAYVLSLVCIFFYLRELSQWQAKALPTLKRCLRLAFYFIFSHTLRSMWGSTWGFSQLPVPPYRL